MCPSGRNLAAGLLGLVITLAPPVQAGGQGLPLSGWEGGLFQIRVPGIATRTVPVLLNPYGSVLLPLAEVVELTESAVEEEPDGALSVLTFSGGPRSRLLLDSLLVVTSRGDSVAVGALEHRRMEGRLMLSTEVLAAWLEAEVDVEWELLRVTLTRDPPFPVQARMDRLTLRTRTLRAQAYVADPLAELDAPFPASSGLGLLSWAVTSGEIDPREASTLSLQLGGALLGGELSVGGAGSAGRVIQERIEYGTATYRRTFPHGSVVRDLFVGDLTTRGPLGHPIRGLLLTNRPRSLPSVFDRVAIDPDIPPGWEFEVYRDGQLVGYSDPLRPGPVNVPVEFGRTDLEIRLYGPGGQETVLSSLYHIPTTQLPEGRVEYSVGAGACRRVTGCRYLAYLDVDYGVTRTLTVGMGGEALQDSLGLRTLRPTASLSYSLAGGWLARLQGVAGHHVDATLDFSGSGWARGSLRGALYGPGAGSLISPSSGQGRWRLSGNLSTRIGRLSLAASGPRGEPAEFLTGTVGRMTTVGYLQAFYERDAYGASGSWGGRVISGWPDQYLSGSTGTLAAKVREGRVHDLEAGLSAAVADGTFLSGSVRWTRRSPALFSLSVSRRMGFGRFHSLLRTNRDGTTRGNYTMAGTVAYEDRGLSAIPDHAVGLSGIRGRVFYDRDGDGVLGPDDTPAPSVDIVAGHHRARTDEDGVYRVWGVSPYDPVVVQMDTVRSFIPDWAPARPRVVLRAVPNLYREVDIPLVRTRELLGSVQAGPGVLTAAGVTLEIENLATGNVERVLTFSDGTFYVPRMRVGLYRLTPSSQSLEALDAVAVPSSVDFAMGAADVGHFLELAPVRLERRSR